MKSIVRSTSVMFALSTFFIAVGVADSGVKVTKPAPGKIMLHAESCSILDHQTEALAAWKTKIGEQPGSASACKCSSSDGCQVEITRVVPALVRKVEEKRPDFMGPNCWNASLVTGKLLPGLRYSTPEEMSFWMSSPLCKERGGDEKPQPGDIIAIRARNGGEDHGFVYLTDEMAFSKNGYDRSEPYRLQSPQNVFSVYKVPAQCQRVQGRVDSPACPFYANFFNCTTLDQYIRERHFKKPEELASCDERVCEAELQIMHLALDGKHRHNHSIHDPTPKELARTIGNTLVVLNKLATTQVNKPHSETESFLWKSLIVRIDAARAQLGNIY